MLKSSLIGIQPANHQSCGPPWRTLCTGFKLIMPIFSILSLFSLFCIHHSFLSQLWIPLRSNSSHSLAQIAVVEHVLTLVDQMSWIYIVKVSSLQCLWLSDATYLHTHTFVSYFDMIEWRKPINTISFNCVLNDNKELEYPNLFIKKKTRVHIKHLKNLATN